MGCATAQKKTLPQDVMIRENRDILYKNALSKGALAIETSEQFCSTLFERSGTMRERTFVTIRILIISPGDFNAASGNFNLVGLVMIEELISHVM